jgi:cysteine dioxygenase
MEPATFARNPHPEELTMTSPISTLQRDLLQEFERDPRGAHVARILAEYVSAHDDWRAYALFHPDMYTRNLVARNEEFEMLILCWSEEQASPIHNHAGQNCWMAVLEGTIEETLYVPPPGGAAGPLSPRNTKLYTPGRVAFINDDIALHRVRPASGGRGISLHLYAKPIDVCNVYDEVTGQVVQSSLVYHSVDRVLGGTEAGSPRR